MKNHNLQSFVFFLTLSLIFIFSCKEKDTESDPAPDQTSTTINLDANHTLTVFENLTNDANADALQAQIINTKQKTTLNIYGKFSADKSPLFNKISTITHHKEGNDTTGYFLINPTTGKLQTAYISVKGVKQPVVINHEYKDGDNNALYISVYDYNWETKQGILKYKTLFEQAGGIINETPNFLLRKTKTTGLGAELSNGLKEALGGVIPEVYPRFSARISGLELVIGGALAYIIADKFLEMYHGKDGINLPDLINPSPAAEVIPSKNPPKTTPINNPATGNNNPTPNLPPSNCGQIAFDVTMGADGNIIVSNIRGGTGPYEYRVGISSSFDGSPITSTKYEDGTYIINVKDAKGCIGVMGVTLKKPTLPTGIVGRWNIVRWYYEDNTSKGEWFNVPPGDHLTLDSNGNFTMRYDGGGENGAGSYVFDKDKMQLILTFGTSGKLVANITKFTDTELIIDFRVGDEHDIFEMKR